MISFEDMVSYSLLLTSSHRLTVSSGCRIEYLPPYSPDFNPIEQAFSVIKSYLRRSGLSFYHSQELYYEMYCACELITPEKTWGMFVHSGYLV
jgi:transposase